MLKTTKGDEIQVFVYDEALKKYKSIAFATNHVFTLTGNTTDTGTKDSGVFNASEVGSISWEITTENLYTDEGYELLYDAMIAMTPIKIAWANAVEQGTELFPTTGIDNETSWFEPNTKKTWYTGSASITSLVQNSNHGEKAKYSCTFTGAGAITKVPKASA